MSVLSNLIIEHLPERNPIDVINVVKLFFYITGLLYVMKEHILERDPVNVINVVKHLQVMVSLNII